MDIVKGVALDVNAQSDALDKFGFRRVKGTNVGTLAVKFGDRVRADGTVAAGGIYTFNGVPVNVYRQLRYAKSRGEFFVRRIRATYPAELVE